MYYHACAVCANLIGQASGGRIVPDNPLVKTDPGESHSFLASIAAAHVCH